MQLGEEQSEPVRLVPKVYRFCEICKKETLHEIRVGGGIIARLCIPCSESITLYELDRD